MHRIIRIPCAVVLVDGRTPLGRYHQYVMPVTSLEIGLKGAVILVPFLKSPWSLVGLEAILAKEA